MEFNICLCCLLALLPSLSSHSILSFSLYIFEPFFFFFVHLFQLVFSPFGFSVFLTCSIQQSAQRVIPFYFYERNIFCLCVCACACVVVSISLPHLSQREFMACIALCTCKWSKCSFTTTAVRRCTIHIDGPPPT